MSVTDAPARRELSGLLLPAAPSDEEKCAYLKRNRPYLAGAIFAASLSVLFCQLGFELFASPWLFPVTILLVLQLIGASAVIFAGSDFDIKAHDLLVSRPRADWPPVDIFLPVSGEALDVLRNTWEGIAGVLWAYPGLVSAYVLDDAANPAVYEMAREFGFGYVIRGDRPRMRKSGNLNWAFHRTIGELIAVFDADFRPRPDYLLEIVPYFDDRKLGILQTPQFFRNHRNGQTWVERAGNVVQEIFYRNIQPARDALKGSSVCCGTCAVYRRAALAPNGGFTEFAYAEDEHTGLSVREHGHEVKYIPVVLATGMSPGTVDAFVRQQYRWTSGTLSSIRRWPRHKGLRVFIAYASGLFYYLYSAAMVFVGPVVPLAMLVFWPQHVHLYNYFALAPALIAGFILFPLWHREEFGPAVWPLALVRSWAHLFAIWDWVTRRTMQWQATGVGVSPVGRLWAGITVWNGGTAIAWISLAVYRTIQSGSGRFGLIGLLGVFYGALTVFVIAAGDNPVRRAILTIVPRSGGSHSARRKLA